MLGPKLDNVFEAKEGSSRLFTQFISNVIFKKPIQLVDGGKAGKSPLNGAAPHSTSKGWRARKKRKPGAPMALGEVTVG